MNILMEMMVSVPQGTAKCQGRTKAGGRKVPKYPSTKAVSLRLSGCGRNNMNQ